MALGWWGEAGIDQPCGFWGLGLHNPVGFGSQDYPVLWDWDLGAAITQPYGIGIWWARITQPYGMGIWGL